MQLLILTLLTSRELPRLYFKAKNQVRARRRRKERQSRRLMMTMMTKKRRIRLKTATKRPRKKSKCQRDLLPVSESLSIVLTKLSGLSRAWSPNYCCSRDRERLSDLPPRLVQNDPSTSG
jgi:hypothetical protein